jgi:citrate synthase
MKPAIDWLTAEQALDALGVRAQTLYAYVSRRRIEARSDPVDPRRSLYRAADVAALRTRKARGRKPAFVAEDAIAWGEPVLASGITTIQDGHLYYRGRDAVVLADSWSLERVAGLLRGDDVAPSKAVRPPPPALREARARAFAVLAAQAGVDLPARGRSAPALSAEAARLLDCLADAVAGEVQTGLIHERLATAWGADQDGADQIRRALVLLADHELNASTFAARVAASTGASLAASALAGLATLSGPLHGGMSARVRAMISEVERLGAGAAVGGRLSQGVGVPGFGHLLYPDGDPRAAALLEAFRPPATFEATRSLAQALTGAAPNIDFALTALAEALGLPQDAPFLLFAVARCSGWLAHALEQAKSGQLIRPRARYVGPTPA